MFSFIILISWALAFATAQSTTDGTPSPLTTPDYATGSSITATSAGPLVTRVVDIDVGRAGLSFTPSTITANPQDIINFHFWPGNHSVAESSYSAPCVPLAGGVGNTPIFSGFMAVEGTGEGPNMFSMSVESGNPVWLYCSQGGAGGGGHCQSGMAMGINPLSSQGIGSYREAAKGTTSVSPAKLYGGIISPNQPQANMSSSVGASSTTSAGASTSSSTHKSGGAQEKFVAGVSVVLGAVAGLWMLG